MGKVNLDQMQLVDQKERQFAGSSRRYRYDQRGQIGEQWLAFNEWLAVNLDCRVPAYGVVYDADAIGFDYLAAIELEPGAMTPEGQTRLVIPAGRYAVFTQDLPVMQLGAVMDAIYADWLPNSGYQVVQGAANIEQYPLKFDPQTGMGGFSIWVPLSAD